MTIEECEGELRPKLHRKSVSEIPGFPFASFSAVRQALASREFSVKVHHTIAEQRVFGATVSRLAAAIPILFYIVLLTAAIVRGEPWLVLGALFAFLGKFAAERFSVGCATIGVLATCITGWYFMGQGAGLGIVLLPLPLVFLTNTVLYALNVARLRNWATSSEVVFIGLFEQNKLGLINRESGAQFWALELEDPQSGAALSPEIQSKVAMLFAPEEQKKATRMLLAMQEEESSLMTGDFGLGLQDAALKVSHGDLERLRKAMEAGREDFRVLLSAAGSGAQEEWQPTPGKVSQWERLREWLWGIR
jgi:hypothetical protein